MEDKSEISEEKLKLLENLKNKLTNDEILNYIETFKFFDVDGDGEINTKDVFHIMERVSGRRISNATAQKLINQSDITKSGTLTFVEFINMLKSYQKNENRDENEKIVEIFNIFDKDKDGFITVEEMRQTFSDFGDDFDAKRIEAIIRESDQDGDGKLSIEEFIHLFNNNNVDPEEFDMKI
ncbi:hypothetical protein PVAND_011962 [Polypedilum vanderplanki]|uniref:EF-hand domain-containing protein n=1 Tax=Polypedilum vanderplanki TaxID=319348 RepID=A0A9J6CKW6_POLVA|nr:hypothetical protein PVAND_011962 [Polypedilum vanderplanki]